MKRKPEKKLLRKQNLKKRALMRPIAMLLVFVMFLGAAPADLISQAWAAEIGTAPAADTVEPELDLYAPPAANVTFKAVYNLRSSLADITSDGIYKVTQTTPGTAAANTIIVRPGVRATVYLDNVFVNAANPIYVYEGAKLTLVLMDKTSSRLSGNSATKAAVMVHENGEFNIQTEEGDTPGILTVSVPSNATAAAIGGNGSSNGSNGADGANNLTAPSGTKGGDGRSGGNGGAGSNGGTIRIYSGDVRVTGNIAGGTGGNGGNGGNGGAGSNSGNGGKGGSGGAGGNGGNGGSLKELTVFSGKLTVSGSIGGGNGGTAGIAGFGGGSSTRGSNSASLPGGDGGEGGAGGHGGDVGEVNFLGGTISVTGSIQGGNGGVGGNGNFGGHGASTAAQNNTGGVGGLGGSGGAGGSGGSMGAMLIQNCVLKVSGDLGAGGTAAIGGNGNTGGTGGGNGLTAVTVNSGGKGGVGGTGGAGGSGGKGADIKIDNATVTAANAAKGGAGAKGGTGGLGGPGGTAKGKGGKAGNGGNGGRGGAGGAGGDGGNTTILGADSVVVLTAVSGFGTNGAGGSTGAGGRAGYTQDSDATAGTAGNAGGAGGSGSRGQLGIADFYSGNIRITQAISTVVPRPDNGTYGKDQLYCLQVQARYGPSSLAVPDALLKLEVTGTDGEYTYTARTNAQGNAYIWLPAEAAYNVSAHHKTYGNGTGNHTLIANDTQVLPIELKIPPLNLLRQPEGKSYSPITLEAVLRKADASKGEENGDVFWFRVPVNSNGDYSTEQLFLNMFDNEVDPQDKGDSLDGESLNLYQDTQEILEYRMEADQNGVYWFMTHYIDGGAKMCAIESITVDNIYTPYPIYSRGVIKESGEYLYGSDTYYEPVFASQGIYGLPYDLHGEEDGIVLELSPQSYDVVELSIKGEFADHWVASLKNEALPYQLTLDGDFLANTMCDEGDASQYTITYDNSVDPVRDNWRPVNALFVDREGNPIEINQQTGTTINIPLESNGDCQRFMYLGGSFIPPTDGRLVPVGYVPQDEFVAAFFMACPNFRDFNPSIKAGVKRIYIVYDPTVNQVIETYKTSDGRVEFASDLETLELEIDYDKKFREIPGYVEVGYEITGMKADENGSTTDSYWLEDDSDLLEELGATGSQHKKISVHIDAERLEVEDGAVEVTFYYEPELLSGDEDNPTGIPKSKGVRVSLLWRGLKLNGSEHRIREQMAAVRDGMEVTFFNNWLDQTGEDDHTISDPQGGGQWIFDEPGEEEQTIVASRTASVIFNYAYDSENNDIADKYQYVEEHFLLDGSGEEVSPKVTQYLLMGKHYQGNPPTVIYGNDGEPVYVLYAVQVDEGGREEGAATAVISPTKNPVHKVTYWYRPAAYLHVVWEGKSYLGNPTDFGQEYVLGYHGQNATEIAREKAEKDQKNWKLKSTSLNGVPVDLAEDSEDPAVVMLDAEKIQELYVEYEEDGNVTRVTVKGISRKLVIDEEAGTEDWEETERYSYSFDLRKLIESYDIIPNDLVGEALAEATVNGVSRQLTEDEEAGTSYLTVFPEKEEEGGDADDEDNITVKFYYKDNTTNVFVYLKEYIAADDSEEVEPGGDGGETGGQSGDDPESSEEGDEDEGEEDTTFFTILIPNVEIGSEFTYTSPVWPDYQLVDAEKIEDESAAEKEKRPSALTKTIYGVSDWNRTITFWYEKASGDIVFISYDDEKSDHQSGSYSEIARSYHKTQYEENYVFQEPVPEVDYYDLKEGQDAVISYTWQEIQDLKQESDKDTLEIYIPYVRHRAGVELRAINNYNGEIIQYRSYTPPEDGSIKDGDDENGDYWLLEAVVSAGKQRVHEYYTYENEMAKLAAVVPGKYSLLTQGKHSVYVLPEDEELEFELNVVEMRYQSQSVDAVYVRYIDSVTLSELHSYTIPVPEDVKVDMSSSEYRPDWEGYEFLADHPETKLWAVAGDDNGAVITFVMKDLRHTITVEIYKIDPEDPDNLIFVSSKDEKAVSGKLHDIFPPILPGYLCVRFKEGEAAERAMGERDRVPILPQADITVKLIYQEIEGYVDDGYTTLEIVGVGRNRPGGQYNEEIYRMPMRVKKNTQITVTADEVRDLEPSWVLANGQSSREITVGEKDLYTLDFVYLYNLETVTIRTLDYQSSGMSGEILTPITISNVSKSAPFSYDAPVIPGYQLVDKDNSGAYISSQTKTLDWTESKPELAFYYEKADGNVTIRHLDSRGELIAVTYENIEAAGKSVTAMPLPEAEAAKKYYKLAEGEPQEGIPVTWKADGTEENVDMPPFVVEFRYDKLTTTVKLKAMDTILAVEDPSNAQITAADGQPIVLEIEGIPVEENFDYQNDWDDPDPQDPGQEEPAKSWFRQLVEAVDALNKGYYPASQGSTLIYVKAGQSNEIEVWFTPPASGSVPVMVMEFLGWRDPETMLEPIVGEGPLQTYSLLAAPGETVTVSPDPADKQLPEIEGYTFVERGSVLSAKEGQPLEPGGEAVEYILILMEDNRPLIQVYTYLADKGDEPVRRDSKRMEVKPYSLDVPYEPGYALVGYEIEKKGESEGERFGDDLSVIPLAGIENGDVVHLYYDTLDKVVDDRYVTIEIIGESGGAQLYAYTVRGKKADADTPEEEQHIIVTPLALSGYALKESAPGQQPEPSPADGSVKLSLNGETKEHIFYYDSLATSVIVRMEDESGETIAAPYQVEAMKNEPFTTNAPAISGWYLAGNSTVAAGDGLSYIGYLPKVTEQDRTITFIYNKIEGLLTLEAREDTTGAVLAILPIAEDDLVNGQTYTYVDEEIADLLDLSGDYYSPAKPQTVQFTYDDTNSQTVTALYHKELVEIQVVGINEERSDQTELLYEYTAERQRRGEAVTVTATDRPETQDYRLLPPVTQTVVADEDVVVEFYYREIGQNEILVKALGKEEGTGGADPWILLQSYVLTGKNDSSIQIRAPKLSGWKLDQEEPSIRTGIVGTDKTVDFHYGENAAVAHIRLLDQKGDDIVVPGYVYERKVPKDLDFTIYAPHIMGYTPDGDCETVQFFPDVKEDLHVTFTYKEAVDASELDTVSIDIIGRSGSIELYRYTITEKRWQGPDSGSGSGSGSGQQGRETVEIELIPMRGYEVVIPSNVNGDGTVSLPLSGELTSYPIEYVSLSTYVEIRTLDQAGNQISPSFRVDAQAGDPFTYNAPHLDGYALISSTENQTAKPGSSIGRVNPVRLPDPDDEPSRITFTYKKVETALSLVAREYGTERIIQVMEVVDGAAEPIDPQEKQWELTVPPLTDDYYTLHQSNDPKVTFSWDGSSPTQVSAYYTKDLAEIEIHAKEEEESGRDLLEEPLVLSGFRKGEAAGVNGPEPDEPGYLLISETPQKLIPEKNVETVTFFYREIGSDQVAVKAVAEREADEEGPARTELLMSYALKAQTGTALTVKAPPVSGYKLTAEDADKASRSLIVGTDQEAVFHYEEDVAVITVSFVDIDTTKPLHKEGYQTKQKVQKGETYTVYGPQITGYFIVGEEEKTFYNLQTDQPVTFYYRSNDSQYTEITVKGVDGSDKELYSYETTVKKEEVAVLKASQIPSYVADETDPVNYSNKDVATGIFMEAHVDPADTSSYAFRYRKNVEDVTVVGKILDEDGSLMVLPAAGQTITGIVGEKLTINAPVAEGYELTALKPDGSAQSPTVTWIVAGSDGQEEDANEVEFFYQKIQGNVLVQIISQPENPQEESVILGQRSHRFDGDWTADQIVAQLNANKDQMLPALPQGWLLSEDAPATDPSGFKAGDQPLAYVIYKAVPDVRTVQVHYMEVKSDGTKTAITSVDGVNPVASTTETGRAGERINILPKAANMPVHYVLTGNSVTPTSELPYVQVDVDPALGIDSGGEIQYQSVTFYYENREDQGAGAVHILVVSDKDQHLYYNFTKVPGAKLGDRYEVKVTGYPNDLPVIEGWKYSSLHDSSDDLEGNLTQAGAYIVLVYEPDLIPVKIYAKTVEDGRVPGISYELGDTALPTDEDYLLHKTHQKARGSSGAIDAPHPAGLDYVVQMSASYSYSDIQSPRSHTFVYEPVDDMAERDYGYVNVIGEVKDSGQKLYQYELRALINDGKISVTLSDSQFNLMPSWVMMAGQDPAPELTVGSDNRAADLKVYYETNLTQMTIYAYEHKQPEPGQQKPVYGLEDQLISPIVVTNVPKTENPYRAAAPLISGYVLVKEDGSPASAEHDRVQSVDPATENAVTFYYKKAEGNVRVQSIELVRDPDNPDAPAAETLLWEEWHTAELDLDEQGNPKPKRIDAPQVAYYELAEGESAWKNAYYNGDEVTVKFVYVRKVSNVYIGAVSRVNDEEIDLTPADGVFKRNLPVLTHYDTDGLVGELETKVKALTPAGEPAYELIQGPGSVIVAELDKDNQYDAYFEPPKSDRVRVEILVEDKADPEKRKLLRAYYLAAATGDTVTLLDDYTGEDGAVIRLNQFPEMENGYEIDISLEGTKLTAVAGVVDPETKQNEKIVLVARDLHSTVTVMTKSGSDAAVKVDSLEVAPGEAPEIGVPYVKDFIAKTYQINGGEAKEVAARTVPVTGEDPQSPGVWDDTVVLFQYESLDDIIDQNLLRVTVKSAVDLADGPEQQLSSYSTLVRKGKTAQLTYKEEPGYLLDREDARNWLSGVIPPEEEAGRDSKLGVVEILVDEDWEENHLIHTFYYLKNTAFVTVQTLNETGDEIPVTELPKGETIAPVEGIIGEDITVHAPALENYELIDPQTVSKTVTVEEGKIVTFQYKKMNGNVQIRLAEKGADISSGGAAVDRVLAQNSLDIPVGSSLKDILKELIKQNEAQEAGSWKLPETPVGWKNFIPEDDQVASWMPDLTAGMSQNGSDPLESMLEKNSKAVLTYYVEQDTVQIQAAYYDSADRAENPQPGESPVKPGAVAIASHPAPQPVQVGTRGAIVMADPQGLDPGYVLAGKPYETIDVPAAGGSELTVYFFYDWKEDEGAGAITLIALDQSTLEGGSGGQALTGQPIDWKTFYPQGVTADGKYTLKQSDLFDRTGWTYLGYVKEGTVAAGYPEVTVTEGGVRLLVVYSKEKVSIPVYVVDEQGDELEVDGFQYHQDSGSPEVGQGLWYYAEGQKGHALSVNPPHFDDYELAASSPQIGAPGQGAVLEQPGSDGQKEIRFTYRRKDDNYTKVTVEAYLLENGQPTAQPVYRQQHTVKTGVNTFEYPKLPSYLLAAGYPGNYQDDDIDHPDGPGMKTINAGEGVDRIAFYYTRSEADVITYTKDESGAFIGAGSSGTPLTARIGQQVVIQAPVVDGYELLKTVPEWVAVIGGQPQTASRTVTVGDDGGEETFYYQKIEGNVLIQLVDEDNRRNILYQESRSFEPGTTQQQIVDLLKDDPLEMPYDGWKHNSDQAPVGIPDNFQVDKDVISVLQYPMTKDWRHIQVYYLKEGDYENGFTPQDYVAQPTVQKAQAGQRVTVLARPESVDSGYVIKGEPYVDDFEVRASLNEDENELLAIFQFEDRSADGVGQVILLAVGQEEGKEDVVLSWENVTPDGAKEKKEYTFDAAEVDGWKLAEGQADKIKVVMTKEGQIVPVYYVKDQAAVEIHLTDLSGKRLPQEALPAGIQYADGADGTGTLYKKEYVLKDLPHTVSFPALTDYLLMEVETDGEKKPDGSVYFEAIGEKGGEVYFRYQAIDKRYATVSIVGRLVTGADETPSYSLLYQGQKSVKKDEAGAAFVELVVGSDALNLEPTYAMIYDSAQGGAWNSAKTTYTVSFEANEYHKTIYFDYEDNLTTVYVKAVDYNDPARGEIISAIEIANVPLDSVFTYSSPRIPGWQLVKAPQTNGEGSPARPYPESINVSRTNNTIPFYYVEATGNQKVILLDEKGQIIEEYFENVKVKEPQEEHGTFIVAPELDYYRQDSANETVEVIWDGSAELKDIEFRYSRLLQAVTLEAYDMTDPDDIKQIESAEGDEVVLTIEDLPVMKIYDHNTKANLDALTASVRQETGKPYVLGALENSRNYVELDETLNHHKVYFYLPADGEIPAEVWLDENPGGTGNGGSGGGSGSQTGSLIYLFTFQVESTPGEIIELAGRQRPDLSAMGYELNEEISVLKAQDKHSQGVDPGVLVDELADSFLLIYDDDRAKVQVTAEDQEGSPIGDFDEETGWIAVYKVVRGKDIPVPIPYVAGYKLEEYTVGSGAAQKAPEKSHLTLSKVTADETTVRFTYKEADISLKDVVTITISGRTESGEPLYTSPARTELKGDREVSIAHTPQPGHKLLYALVDGEREEVTAGSVTILIGTEQESREVIFIYSDKAIYDSGVIIHMVDRDWNTVEKSFSVEAVADQPFSYNAPHIKKDPDLYYLVGVLREESRPENGSITDGDIIDTTIGYVDSVAGPDSENPSAITFVYEKGDENGGGQPGGPNPDETATVIARERSDDSLYDGRTIRAFEVKLDKWDDNVYSFEVPDLSGDYYTPDLSKYQLWQEAWGLEAPTEPPENGIDDEVGDSEPGNHEPGDREEGGSDADADGSVDTDSDDVETGSSGKEHDGDGGQDGSDGYEDGGESQGSLDESGGQSDQGDQSQSGGPDRANDQNGASNGQNEADVQNDRNDADGQGSPTSGTRQQGAGVLVGAAHRGSLSDPGFRLAPAEAANYAAKMPVTAAAFADVPEGIYYDPATNSIVLVGRDIAKEKDGFVIHYVKELTSIEIFAVEKDEENGEARLNGDDPKRFVQGRMKEVAYVEAPAISGYHISAESSPAVMILADKGSEAWFRYEKDAADNEKGTVTVSVKDKGGNYVTSAEVAIKAAPDLTDGSAAPVFQSRSGSGGLIQFAELEKGTYLVTVTASGYEAMTEPVVVNDKNMNPVVYVRLNTKNIDGGGNGGGGGNKEDPKPVVKEEEEELAPEALGDLLALMRKGEHVAYLTGYPDGAVRPDQSITRAEAAQMFYQLMKPYLGEEFTIAGTAVTPRSVSYSDISGGQWYTAAVNALSSYGILTGYPDGTFRPDDPITRAEYTVMVSQFTTLLSGSHSFEDARGHWAETYIANASMRGFVSGYPDGTFRPEDNITRAEAVSITNRMLERRIHKDDIPVSAKKYIDLTSSHWAYAEIAEASSAHSWERKSDGYELWK